ncbi:MAG: alpha/beta hydrolase [Verrucomicrobiota bacterium]|nr:alpha/beta hydrolase [Verrucomicrobiota bacterium]
MDNLIFNGTAPGAFATVAGNQIHYRLFLSKSQTTFILEPGLTLTSSVWAWLAPELAREHTVLIYDRAGLGWSEEREGIRDARQIATELHELLHSLALPRPFTLVGHSMGALFVRAYHLLYPQEVASLILLDPSHPRQMELSRGIRRKMRNFFFYLETASLLSRANLIKDWHGSPLAAPVNLLPAAEASHLRAFFQSPGHLRTSAREARSWKQSADFVHQQKPPAIPVTIISAQKHAMPGWIDLQHELARNLHARHHLLTHASHMTLLTDQSLALRVASEILSDR